MSGHSKWSTIKHKKGIADAKRGKIFSKLSREITVAARVAGPNPDTNVSLRFIIDRARSYNMPNENIERAINKGIGTGQEKLEELFFEAYGPEKIALLIKVITDNKNRTFNEVRTLIEQCGGKMAQEGSVMWLFERVGRITIEIPDKTSEEYLELYAIECGAQDVVITHDNTKKIIIIITKAEELEPIRNKLLEKNLKVESAELTLIPKNEIQLQEKENLQKLLETLDDHDDVQEIFNNASY